MNVIQSLSGICRCKKDEWSCGVDAYILSFPFAEGVTTIRIVFDDESGAQLAITNMTTLPLSEAGKGHGGKALHELLAWARTQGITDIRAVQVQPLSERFFGKIGFVPLNNQTNDFQLV